MLDWKTLKEIREIDESAYFILILKTASIGSIMENNSRKVEVLDKDAYLLTWFNSKIRIENSALEAYNFLNGGKVEC